MIIFVDPLQKTPNFSGRSFHCLSVTRLLWCSMNGQPWGSVFVFGFLSAGQAVKFIKIQLKDQNLSPPSHFQFESLLGRFWPPDLVFATTVVEIMLYSDCIFFFLLCSGTKEKARISHINR